MEYTTNQLHRRIFFFCMLIYLHHFRSRIHFVFLLQLPLSGAKHYQFSRFSLFSQSIFEGFLMAFQLLIHVPKHFTIKACESLLSVWEKGHFLAWPQPFNCVLHKQKVHWAEPLQKCRIGALNTTTQHCRFAWDLPARFLWSNLLFLSQPKKWVCWFCWVSGKDYPVGLPWIDTHESGLQADRIQAWTFQRW